MAIIDSLRQEGKQKKKLWVEALAENLEALYNFFMLQNYELGFEHHQQVYNLIKNLSPQEFPEKQNCLTSTSMFDLIKFIAEHKYDNITYYRQIIGFSYVMISYLSHY